MRAKVRMLDAVLAGGAGADAVGQDGFQCIEVGTADVGAFVDDKTSDVLADAAAHDASFSMVHGETFFGGDGGGLGAEAVDAFDEPYAAGESKVIRVARVIRASGLG